MLHQLQSQPQLGGPQHSQGTQPVWSHAQGQGQRQGQYAQQPQPQNPLHGLPVDTHGSPWDAAEGLFQASLP